MSKASKDSPINCKEIPQESTQRLVDGIWKLNGCGISAKGTLSILEQVHFPDWGGKRLVILVIWLFVLCFEKSIEIV